MDDAVVIGAGPNGLVAANHLADAGWSVTVLEAASEPGGAVRTAELTVPGFRHDRFSAFYPLAVVSPALAGLDLDRHGLRWRRSPLTLANPMADGRCAIVGPDVATTAASVDRFCAGDGDAWAAMVTEWRKVAAPFLDMLFRPFPPVWPTVRLAGRLGAGERLRFARHLLLPVRRLVEERFGGDGAGSLLAGNALHADLSPESAGSGLYGWLLSCLAQDHGFPVPEGGAGRLTAALVDRLADRGGTVHCDQPVVEVVVRRGRAVAVRTADGTEVDARRAVIADVPAPTLYGRLVDRRHLPAALLDDVARFQWDPGTVKVDWALDRPVPWSAADARLAGTVHVTDGLDGLTEQAAQLATGRLPARPFLVFGQQAVTDPTRSPPGTDTAWAYTRVPRRLRGDAAGELDVAGGEAGWVERFADRMEDRVEALAPGFKASIRARHVAGPAALAAANQNLDGGAVGGGTAELHQQLLFRPVPGTGRPETPVAALYLASASAHPGGGVHGAAGANAARAALLPAARARAVAFGRAPLRPPR